MERLTTKDRLLLVGLFLLEAIIMFCIVPKANADEISVQVELVLGLSLALMISLAILIKHNRGKCKTMLSIFIVCAATYLQISYCSLFYEWGVVICVTLPVFQLTFGFLISQILPEYNGLMYRLLQFDVFYYMGQSNGWFLMVSS